MSTETTTRDEFGTDDEEEFEYMSGAEIACLRHVMGLSQTQLGDRVGSERHSVMRWENDLVACPPKKLRLVLSLFDEHTELADEMEEKARRGDPIRISRNGLMRAWDVAAAARVLCRGVPAEIDCGS